MGRKICERNPLLGKPMALALNPEQFKHNPGELSVYRRSSALVNGVICLEALVAFVAVRLQV
jgi:hypothetical protein